MSVSRRTLGAGAALGLIMTAMSGARAQTAPIDAVSPDAEILALRAEFVRLHDQYVPINEVALDDNDAFRDQVLENGWDAACAWSKATGRNRPNKELELMSAKLDGLAERMLDLGPTTPAGIAAVAATLRDDHLAYYWDKPVRDRDYDVELVTRFIDGLIGATVGGAA
jgi:hypothetical protein